MNPESESNIVNNMHRSYDSGLWDEVVELSQHIESNSSNFLESCQLAAIAEYQLGNLDKAIQCLGEVINTEHNNANLFLNYANFMALANKPEEAVTYFNKSLKLNPTSAAAHNNLGSVFFDLKKFDYSLNCFLSAIKFKPNYWEAFSSIGNVYFQQQQYQQALENYQKAFDLHPKDLGLLNNFALALMQTGSLDRAAELFQKALKMSPQDANLFIPLSAILNTLGAHSDAEKVLNAGIESTPWYFSNTQSDLKKLTEVLSFSGLESSLYDLDENNQVKLNGGHFYSKYLIEEAKFRRCKYHILNKNIESEKHLPEIKLFINTISDPDLEKQSLISLSKYLSIKNDIAIINHPDQVLLTSRDNNYQRFKNIKGLRFPKTIRIFIEQPKSLIKTIMDAFEFPLLIRKSGTQTGTSFVKIKDQEELLKIISSLKGFEIYVIEYIDTHFSDENKNTLFRRFRFFFIDNIMYPVTCHIHQSWNVHSIDRSSVMQQQEDLKTIEEDFLNGPKNIIGNENYNALSKLPEIVGLDFFGVDFSVTQDNQLVLFEVNAAMNHTYNYVDKFPYLKRHLEEITYAFHRLIEKRHNSLK
ncbi:MAG: tetratricopeptide repeat protein [Methylococcales bacterium]